MMTASAPATPAKVRGRLWVISEVFYPEVTSTGFYLTQIAEGLAEEMQVSAICGQPNYLSRGIMAPPRETHNGVDIHRVSGTRMNKDVIPFRVINMITHGISVFFAALRNFGQGDRVLVVTTPPSLPFVAAFAALMKGASYTLLIHDNYPEILIAAKKAKPDSWVVRANHFFNRWLYKYATRMIVVGRDMEKLVASKADGLSVPVVTIPNWGETGDVFPTPRSDNSLLKELGLEDKLVFLYAGNMGHPNDIESIVDAATLLQDTPDIHFIFLGTGAKRKRLERMVAASNANNITLLDPRPRAEQIVFLNACDVAIVSLVSQMWGVSMPSRTYNALAAGKPILALTEPDSEVALTIADDNIGWVVTPERPEYLAETIRGIYADRTNLPDMAVRARKAAEEKFSPATALSRYLDIFREDANHESPRI